MYIARKSNHIQADIKRNWSSWNFGEDGIFGTQEQIEAWKAEAVENNQGFYISGFELWGDDIKKADIRELYAAYWVLVDNENGIGDGIFGTALKSENLEDAVKEAQAIDYSGEGTKFDASEAILVKSINNEIHIFEL